MFLSPFKKVNQPKVNPFLSKIHQRINPRLAQILEDDKKIPKIKVLLMVYMLAVKVMVVLLLGGKTESLIGIKKCSWVYWTVFLIYFVISIEMILIGGYVLSMEFQNKLECDYRFEEF